MGYVPSRPPVPDMVKRLREDNEARDEADRQIRPLEQDVEEWDLRGLPPWREPLPSEMR